MTLTIEKALELAEDAIKSANFDEAKRLYQLIVKERPKHPDSNHNLGLLNLMAGKTPEALKFFEAALSANPNVEQFWLSYIETLIKDNRQAAAQEALQSAPPFALSTESLTSLRKLVDSESDKTTKKKSPSLSETQGKQSHKDSRANVKSLGAVTSSEPDPEQQERLLACYNSGRLNQTAQLASTLTKKFPRHALSWKILAAALLQRGQIAEALHASQNAAQLSPEDPETQNLLGAIYKSRERLREAESSYRRALSLNPQYTEAQFNLSLVLLDLGKVKAAKESCLRAIALDPNHIEAHFNLGAVNTRLGELSEAERAYRRVISLAPRHSRAHNNLGFLLQQTGRTSEAEESIREAVLLDSELSEAHFNLGNILLDKKILDEAEQRFHRALELAPHHAKSFSQLGCVLYEQGLHEKALGAFKRCYELNPLDHTNFARLEILKARQVSNASRSAHDATRRCPVKDAGKFSTDRAVEPELINAIYDLESRDFENTPDTRFGAGRCSPDFELFRQTSVVIRSMATELTEIMRQAVACDIFVCESFFNIMTTGGGGTIPHHHVKEYDRHLDIGKQKYSLVYYLSVGDQNCSEPGVLTLSKPDEKIIPNNGMIVIIPAIRPHFATYNGMQDRVMVGANFYAINT